MSDSRETKRPRPLSPLVVLFGLGVLIGLGLVLVVKIATALAMILGFIFLAGALTLLVYSLIAGTGRRSKEEASKALDGADGSKR